MIEKSCGTCAHVSENESGPNCDPCLRARTLHTRWKANPADQGPLETGEADAVVPGPVPGRKDDTGKLDMTLLDDMPRAIKALVEVMQWAIEKKAPLPYRRSSWLGVGADRYRAAILRHIRDAQEQASKHAVQGSAARFERDHETKLLHLAHTACSAMMALENTLREMEKA